MDKPLTEMPPHAARPDTTHPVVLFDGVCNLCNRCVRFIARRDPRARFRFAALQSEVGRQMLAAHGRAPGRLDTMVLVDDGRVFTRSDAALRIARDLRGPWKLLAAAAAVIPRPLRDWLYDQLAARRYRWFGRQDSCPLPEPGLAERFLAWQDARQPEGAEFTSAPEAQSRGRMPKRLT